MTTQLKVIGKEHIGKIEFTGIEGGFGDDVHTGYKMLENTDLKLSVFQHFFILVSY